ncbi:hypothetical protein [Desulfofustis limnaeus]|jgi:hypothetical protein|uniref:Uncharacterized protein n=1 Tax=Desulfofustis limnaeus TaxID=2740163 RepID=A0ABM7WA67_9BACT|nr:hypothetical protein [Desulfofustis limnaeus]MDX9896390.1 hypothetical protein [Desulfofustis sp.]BDD87764.1 hypothetical protein DPPLL_21290 [Desulfofustis limnaeus]
MSVVTHHAADDSGRPRHHDPHLLIVGGSGRNVGKTECVCRVISHGLQFRPDIYALKVSAVYPGELVWHGSHQEDEPPFHLFEENDRTSAKDTGRMLRAGARRVFYLRCDDTAVEAAYHRVRRMLPPEATLVCESNSLANFVRPGLLLAITTPHGPVKPRSRPLLELADLLMVSDGTSGFPEIASIGVDELGCWRLTDR